MSDFFILGRLKGFHLCNPRSILTSTMNYGHMLIMCCTTMIFMVSRNVFTYTLYNTILDNIVSVADIVRTDAKLSQELFPSFISSLSSYSNDLIVVEYFTSFWSSFPGFPGFQSL